MQLESLDLQQGLLSFSSRALAQRRFLCPKVQLKFVSSFFRAFKLQVWHDILSALVGQMSAFSISASTGVGQVGQRFRKVQGYL
jgi:hypothetical protein